MAPGNAIHRRDRLSEAELASFESQLRKEGYRLAAKTYESELLPGEYMKRKRPTYVYAYASPVVWEVVWLDRDVRRGHPPRNDTVSRGSRQ